MLASVFFLGLIPGAPQTSPPNDGLPAVRLVLQRTEGTSRASEDYLVRRLVALGAEATPALFSLVSGEGTELLLGEAEGEAWLCAPDRISELATLALAELPRVPVLEHLRQVCEEEPTPEHRIAAWTVLERQRSAEALGLTLELADACGDAIEHRALRTPAVTALAAILRSDAQALHAFEPLVLAAPLRVRVLACEALARCPRPDSLGVLVKLLGKTPALDLAVVRACSSLGQRSPWTLGDQAAGYLRKALAQGTPPLRTASAEALGHMRDAQAVPTLIACLSDSGPALERASRWALREISAQSRPSTVDEWEAWLASEQAWWKQDGQRHLEALAQPEGELTASLRALAAHPLGRDRVADTLATTLGTYPASAKALACQTLATLSARRAVPALVELLFDPEESVRMAAWSALRTLTGEELPAEPRLWEEYAFGT